MSAILWITAFALAPFAATSALAGQQDPEHNERQPVKVTADFSTWVDYPLVKTKFGVYNSGYVPRYLGAYRRDLHLFGEVRPDSLRFDGGLGSPRGIIFHNPPMISGTPPEIEYDFRQVDEFLEILRSQDVKPYWSYSYVPENLVQPGQNFRHPPSDLDVWAEVIGTVARHLHESGEFNGYHEIYNEPDNADFFLGTKEDYLDMYEWAVTAIREVAPDARVGGPALAFRDSWVDPFLDRVTENGLPLDFFSFHFYPGNPYEAGNVRDVIDMVRHKLDLRPELATTEMHLNEYNALPINYPEDGPQQKHHLASEMLSDYAYFISQPALTKVHWAQFMDTAGGNWSGIISVSGHRKAVFNGYRIYNMMPVDRRLVSVDGPPGVGGMASSDDHKAALVIWNRSGAGHPFRLDLKHVPFESGDVRIYRIDADHASWGDNPANEELVPVETHEGVAMSDFSWSGDVPDGGVVYIEADDQTEPIHFAPEEVAVPLRVLHYYPDRRKRSYADFDRRTWTARLGMAGEEWGQSMVGVIARDLPEKLSISITVDGELRKLDANSLLGMRLDYEVDNQYAHSVLFHGPHNDGTELYSPRRWATVPWGARPRNDEVVRVTNSAEFEIDVTGHAPPGWTGTALITFILQNAGADVRAKVVVR